MGKYSAYINIKNLTKLNNRMNEALAYPDKELDLTFINNKGCPTIVSYKFYQDCIKNIKLTLNKLKNSKYYDIFAEAVDSFVNKAYLGKEVIGNFYLLSAIGEVASRLNMLCYRGDEIGYEEPDETIKYAALNVSESKKNGKEFSIIEPIYKEIIDAIKENIKDINPKNLPMSLRFYYDMVVNELESFKLN